MTLLILWGPQTSHADEIRLSEKQLLLRCYAQLTGERLPVNSSLWSRLNAERAQNICIELLNSVALKSDGLLEQKENFVHRKILRQFYDLHRSWFNQQWVLSENSPEGSTGTVDILDPTEPSLHITQALFSQTPIHYQEVLRGYSHLKTLREPTDSLRSATTGDILRPSRIYTGAGPFFSTNQVFVGLDYLATIFYGVNIDILPLGDLIGITTENSPALNDVWTSVQTPQTMINEPNIIRPAPIRNNFGGGAMGSSSYFLLYLGHGVDYRADGAAKLPRRWTESVLKQFLCKEGPYVRESDAQNFLVTDSAAPPFRQTVACLRCHSTLDQAARTARNIRLGSSFDYASELKRYTSLVLQYSAVNGYDNSWPSITNDKYHLTQPSGRVFFRDRNGALVDRNVSSINELGIALSENEDYYTCVAQKYFSYFTGIEINLEYLSSPANASSMSAADIEYRDYIKGLGQELKGTGSLKKLLVNIIQSGYYQHAQKER